MTLKKYNSGNSITKKRHSRELTSNLMRRSGAGAAWTIRFNVSYRHLAEPRCSIHSYCQFHYWDTMKRYGVPVIVKKEILFCPDCKVHLCSTCYKPFHLGCDLTGLTAPDNSLHGSTSIIDVNHVVGL